MQTPLFLGTGDGREREEVPWYPSSSPLPEETKASSSQDSDETKRRSSKSLVREWENGTQEFKFMQRYLAGLEAEKHLFMERWINNDTDYEDHSRGNHLSKFRHSSSCSGIEKPRQNLEASSRQANKSSKKKHRRSRKDRRTKEEKFLKRYLAELEEQRGEFVKQLELDNESLASAETASTARCQNWESFFANLEVFVCNMPLTIGAVGLGWVTQGVVWFKFMEENIDDCIPVRYNSPLCSYPEFPGCFECNTKNPIYIAVVSFHYFCHLVGFVCCSLFLLRALFATRAVADELSNPTTSTPMGVVCITMVCVFAGRGKVGELFVVATSIFHFFLALWFLYTAMFKFRLLPDPGWFPNTVGISYAAIKTWLYYPVPGKFLMVVAMIFFFSTYFISLYRVAVNHKIAAPVCFIQLSAPSITLYAMTIMAQASPSREEEIDSSVEQLASFNKIHHEFYVPVQHGMMILSLIGMVSVLHSLHSRWSLFYHKEFSPAHMAFVFPLLSHTNAIQSYRSGVDTFAGIPEGSPLKVLIFSYWFTCLIVGTLVNLVFTAKYVHRLPKWTTIDLKGEKPASEPIDTMAYELLSEGEVREPMTSNVTNAAVLQANEAGTLMRVRRHSDDFRNYGPFVRTRNVASLGFDITMTGDELRQEHSELLNWVAHNAPKARKKTVSVPNIILEDPDLESYGTFASNEAGEAGHKRSITIQ